MIRPSVDQRLSLARHFRLPVLLLRSGRPLSAGLAGALSLAAVWIRSGFFERAVLVGLVMCTVTMFGFVINGILDFEKDVAATVRRPIAMGSLSRQRALMFAVSLLLVVWALCAAVSSGSTVVMLTVLSLVLYTPSARHLPLLKGLYVAGLSMTPLYYASVTSHVNFSGAAYALLALFIFGREMLMDAHEIADDRRAGIRTMAVSLGQSEARRLGAGVMCVFVWPRVEEGRRIAFSRLPMLAAALALVSA